MLIDITQETKIGKMYRQGSPALDVREITCCKGTKSEYKTMEYSVAPHNSGTHIDVMSIGVEIPLERLIGKGIKYDISHIEGRTVEVEDIDLSLIKGGEYIFFQSNWDKYYLTPKKYNNHPEISIELIKKLSEMDINMIGIDTPGLGRGKNHGIIDKILGDSKKYAIENLCNLDKIPKDNFKVYCLPSKIEGLDALQTRILVEF
ncbi:cyclase family protein [uncultured Ilyobacter sp.]|uniref:cyclase family protein n=1 Tax=uncultured Ilyobacter sp. TaxID=544433 RepID=UPI0029BFFBE4|nr:cyclase family protein [uncultured Ilyobacter sp.]